jgi:hypothetical protein
VRAPLITAQPVAAKGEITLVNVTFTYPGKLLFFFMQVLLLVLHLDTTYTDTACSDHHPYSRTMLLLLQCLTTRVA